MHAPQAQPDNPSSTPTAGPAAGERPPLFSAEELAEFKARVSPLIGLDLDAYKPRQMERRLTAVMHRAKADSLKTLADRLEADPGRRDEFVSALTINVTEFFRNPERFEALETQILPELLARFDHLKIWSAGCSHGAELYSIGLVLEQLGALDRCELVGTDLDPKAVQRAEAGVFHDYEVRSMPERFAGRTLQPEGTLFRFDAPAVRERCRFRVHNLLEDAPEPDCHLVVCRNVVIYFNELGKRQLYRRFTEAIAPGGVLFVGNTERIFEHKELGFALAAPFFYRKATS
ncbi:Chemotaxis protein methyltransferase Cher2 [compost metagenome]